jgi:hypothetical protein
LAKIAFCAGVAALGFGAFTNTPIRSVILGTDPCISHWVGSWYDEPLIDTNFTNYGLHAIKVHYNPPDSDIHVIVKLFAQFRAPEYHVMLGEVDPAFVASDEWPSAWKDQTEV